MSEDHPRYEVTKPAGEPLPTNAEIARALAIVCGPCISKQDKL